MSKYMGKQGIINHNKTTEETFSNKNMAILTPYHICPKISSYPFLLSFLLIHTCIYKIAGSVANSVDPDQMLHTVCV